jgi:cation:H+ antiporter
MEYALTLIPWFLALGGAVFGLLRGADFFVAGASTLGQRWGLGSFVVGVLIVGLGTSLPELATALAAVLSGTTEIVIANVVGSNITNILLVAGILALLSSTIVIKEKLLRSELPLFVIATVHFILILLDGEVSRLEGLLLVGTLGAYLWYLWKHAGAGKVNEKTEQKKWQHDVYEAITYVLGGVLATIIGAHYTIVALTEIAGILGVAVSVLTIVLVALGTSLPELAVSFQAVRKGEAEMAIGNIFGSNAFNILAVAGIPAVVAPLSSTPVVQELGLYVMIAASVIFFVHGLARQVRPWEGLMMLLFYGFFLLSLIDFL